MSAFSVLELREIFALLDHCAPGHTKTQTTHYWCIRWEGRTYPTLPLGEHGAGRTKGRVDIRAGHVRQMIRQLQIDLNCAAEVIPQLG